MQRCSFSTKLMQVASSLHVMRDTEGRKEGKREDFKEICQLLNLSLVSSGHPGKFTCDAVTSVFLSQLSFWPLMALSPDLKSTRCDH